MVLLHEAQNGNGEAYTMLDAHNIERNFYSIFIWGTFDSSQVTLEASPDGTTWMQVPDVVGITSEKIINIRLHAKSIRGVVSGGLGSESINMRVL